MIPRNHFNLKKGKTQSSTWELIEQVRCNKARSISAILECMQRLSSKDLVIKASEDFGIEAALAKEKQGKTAKQFAPSVDSASRDPFMPELPLKAMMSGRMKNIPFMTGITKDDGGILVASSWHNLSLFNDNWEEVMAQEIFAAGLNDTTGDQRKIVNNIRR